MPEQAFLPADYSLRTQDLLPAEDTDDEHDGWQDYCYEAAQLDRQHILDAVLSSLDTDDSPLYALIDSCLKDPPEPGRARESITILAQIGQAILNMVAKAVDDQVNLRMAVEVRHG